MRDMIVGGDTFEEMQAWCAALPVLAEDTVLWVNTGPDPLLHVIALARTFPFSFGLDVSALSSRPPFLAAKQMVTAVMVCPRPLHLRVEGEGQGVWRAISTALAGCTPALPDGRLVVSRPE